MASRPLVAAVPVAIEFRRYEPADAPAVWAVHERALEAAGWALDHPGPADGTVDEADLDVTGRYLDVGGEFLVGVVDDAVVAVGGFRPVDDGVVELRRMRVDPAHQRRGYADRLLRELERRAADRGIRRLVLETDAQLRAATRLYEKHGYVETDRETAPETGRERRRYRKALE